MTETEGAPTFEFHECPCDICQCPQVVDGDESCVACRTGHHEAEE